VLTSDQILTNAIHDFDMLQHWLGDIAEVFAMEGPKERPHPVDSTTQLSFKFSSGVVGSFLLTE
jgi:predicted dehydrogenase